MRYIVDHHYSHATRDFCVKLRGSDEFLYTRFVQPLTQPTKNATLLADEFVEMRKIGKSSRRAVQEELALILGNYAMGLG